MHTIYDEYYNISDINSHILNYVLEDNILTAEVDVSIKKTLKVSSPYELPFIIGMQEEIEQFTNDNDIKKANKILDKQIEELNQYIGLVQEQSEILKIEVNVGKSKVKSVAPKVFVKVFDNYIDYEDFDINNEDEMINEGADFLQDSMNEPIKSTRALNFTYDRFAARDYALKYSDNCGGCHCSKCGGSVYNSAYTSYHGNDCANFVSQCLKAGGVPTDSSWKPGSTYWINTGKNTTNGLIDYMVDSKGYFKATTKTTTPAGGWFLFDSSWAVDHVGFVVSNDTVTMLYSAHTNDRKNSSFASMSGGKFYYINQ